MLSTSFRMGCSDALRPFAQIGAAIVVAAAVPWAACSDCDAPLQPEVTVFWIVIPAIFLLEGLSLPTTAVLHAAKRVGVHSAVLAFNFGVIPLVVAFLQPALNPFPSGLRDGYFALAAVPTTTSMCVMHSSVAGANAPLAAFAALLGNSLAIAVTPTLLAYECRTSVVDYKALVVSVACKMVVPLCLGQALRPTLGAFVSSRPSLVPLVNKSLISCLLLQIFSDIFYWGRAVSAAMLALLLLTVVVLHLLFLGLSWQLSGVLHLEMADRVPFMFSASQKTVVLGLPLLRAIFAERPPEERALVLLPLIAYHIFSLLFGLGIAPLLRGFVVDASVGTKGEGLLTVERAA
jgi:sodium/bile acid cotransporter 7